MCTSIHQFIHLNPIKLTDTKIIIGTIHPHINRQISNPCSPNLPTNQSGPAFQYDFFYGSCQNSLWDIIQRIHLVSFANAIDIQNFLSHKNIAISDMICECERPNCSETKDSKLTSIVYNQNLLCKIVNSNITTLLFTSSFGTNNAAALFYNHFKIPKPNPLPVSGDVFQETLNCNGMTKTVDVVLLPSPSGLANLGLVNNKNFKNSGFTCVKQWKDAFYSSHI